MQEHLYPHMVQEYYVQIMRRLSAERDLNRARVKTRADLRVLQRGVRRRLAESFGKFPEKTPLNPVLTGKFERKNHCVEKIIFESRPGLFVTANLYVPKKKNSVFPCVLGTCGHSGLGKAEPNYQYFCQNLAALGYLVMIYDPLSQGERIQYPVREGRAHPEGCCQEHNLMGNQMALAGDCFCKWRLWDGIRALDYLLSRPEADPARVGVTGNSGGGTMTTYLNAFDERFTMAAPSCFITTYLHNLENELPADSEQIPPNIIKFGLDLADFFIARIPRPVILLGQNNDYFDRRGLIKAYREIKRLYALAGAEKNVELYIGPRGHGYFRENREAMYAFFNKHAGISASPKEIRVAAEPRRCLRASPRGQVYKMGGRRVFDFTRATAAAVNKRRGKIGAAALNRNIRQILGITENRNVPYYRVLRTRWKDVRKYEFDSSFAVETEPGIQAILHVYGTKEQHFFHIPKMSAARLYIPHVSSREDISAGHVSMSAEPLLALDVRGIGQTKALTCADEDFFTPYGSDYFYASYALMMGKSYLGRRVHDLLSVLNLLRSEGFSGIHLIGRGLGALTATFAACLHPLVKKVTLKNTLLSYYELTQAPVQSWPFSAMPVEVLRHFDLPDCYRALASRQLTLVLPWNSQMRLWNNEKIGAHARALGIDLKRIKN